MPAGNFGESQHFAGGFLSAEVAKQIEDLLSGAVEKAVEKIDTAGPSSSPVRSEQPAQSSNPSTDKVPRETAAAGIILSGDAGPRGNHSYWTGPDNPGTNNPKAAPTTTAPIASGSLPETAAGGVFNNVFKELFGSGAVHESLATSVISGVGSSAVTGMTGSHLLGNIAGRYIRSKINEPVGQLFDKMRDRFMGGGEAAAQAGLSAAEEAEILAKGGQGALDLARSQLASGVAKFSQGAAAGGVQPIAAGGGGAAIPPVAAGTGAAEAGAMGSVAALLTNPLTLAIIAGIAATSIANNRTSAMMNSGADFIGGLAKNGIDIGGTGQWAADKMDPLQKMTGGWINLSIWDDALRASIKVVEDFDEAFEGLAKELNNYSPSVAYANSQRELRMELAKYRRGQSIGEEVGRFSSAKSQLDTALYDIMTEFYDAVAPLVADGAEAIADIAKIARDFAPLIKLLADLPVAELRIALLILQSQVPWQVRLLSSILGAIDHADDPLDTAIGKELDKLLDPKAVAKNFPGMKLPGGLL